MKLAAGMLHPEPQATGVRDTTLVQFALSPDELDETLLLEAAFASPGRYAGEMLRRLRRLEPHAPAYLVVNPFLELDPRLVSSVLQGALEREGRAAVFVDERARPLAYLVPAAAAARLPAEHLGLLSSSDGALDARLLAASIGAQVATVRTVDRALSCREQANGFWKLSPAVRLAAAHAVALLESLPDAAARQRAVDGSGRTAMIAFHAGDVLFAAQALQLEKTTFRSVAVLAPYVDIVEYAAPWLECLPIRQPIPYRAGHTVDDDLALLWSYALRLEDEGAGGRLWHLFRPFRDYNRVRHHLRESSAFALGGPGHAARAAAPLPAALLERQLSTPTPGRIVVQFEGGWTLKEFPRERRAELLALLADAGYEPIVLGAPVPAAPAVPSQPYRGLAAFRELLASAQALIGCDSFPAHFSQVLGVPTLQLYGSTRPVQSRGRESLGYRYLHNPLPCVPCGQTTICNLDGGTSCQAHVTPSDVVAALRELSPPPGRAGAHPVVGDYAVPPRSKSKADES